ncbi:hypothetical protein V2G26_014249 [Clonostachys chloroleuca]
MPMHKGILPREGFCADVILNLIRTTALNPSFLLPLILLGRFTKTGRALSTQHGRAHNGLYTLFYVAVARVVNNWLSNMVSNNWVSDKYDWEKEIVLVTGGSGGIGGCMVRLFDELGVKVVILDIQPMALSTSGRISYYNCDLRSPESVNAVADRIRTEVGHPTVIINNAGVVRGKTILDSDPSDIRFTFDVNTFAAFWVTKAFLPNLIARDHGMIVTVTSTASWLAIPNLTDYCGSKAASLALHEGLAAELKSKYNAPKVRTVVVHPGHTRTPLFEGYNQDTAFLMPEQQPESIAEAVVKQVMSGRSGSVIVPQTVGMLSPLRAMPEWYGRTVRSDARIMSNWNGRQVISDVSGPQDHKQAQSDESESVLLVP